MLLEQAIRLFSNIGIQVLITVGRITFPQSPNMWLLYDTQRSSQNYTWTWSQFNECPPDNIKNSCRYISTPTLPSSSQPR